MTGQNIARQEIQAEIEEERRGYHVTDEGERCQKLTSKPQPRGDTQINRYGLI